MRQYESNFRFTRTMEFKNKVVIVTGAASGIGAATAISFNAQGAKIVMVDRNEDKLINVAMRCSNPLVIHADVSVDEDVKRIVTETINKFNQIDVLINNAGVTPIAALLDSNIMEVYDTCMKVNLRGVIHLTSLAAPYLIKTKGNVVNISSVAALITPLLPGWISYHVAKAAVCHFSACAAAELATHGVRVNSISPGPVKTDILRNSNLNTNWDDVKSYNSLGRVSEPEEIADLILFLASEKAKGMTGTNYLSDNGVLIKRS